ERLTGELIRTQIGVMVGDLIATSRANIAAAGVGSAADVRAAGRALIGWSPAMQEAERTLKRFMYAALYRHPHQLAAADIAHGIVMRLAHAYADDPAQLPDDWRARLPKDEPWRSRHIADFIAGMTDRYAIGRYRTLIGPIDLPDGF
ncbi:MAG: deoxyguanosinetriphosphate triphosphohydrolase, partial [Zymomonas sp.]|nr:deoxyguanosinetriphosphate triphosphohydrolase [Zymomonas sp.]